MNEWQDISTAPKDGTWIWAYLPEARKKSNRWKLKPRQVAIHWSTNQKAVSPIATERLAARGGFWSAHSIGFRPLRDEPTHWMSLPEPPK